MATSPIPDDELKAAQAVARGICRLFARNDIWCLPEMPLRSNRRADLMGIDAKGHLVIVEIKVARADLLGGRLDMVITANAAELASSSGYVKELTLATSGRYAGLYNGNITFTSSLSDFTPSPIGTGLSFPIIAPYWFDIDTRGGVLTTSPGGTSPRRSSPPPRSSDFRRSGRSAPRTT